MVLCLARLGPYGSSLFFFFYFVYVIDVCHIHSVSNLHYLLIFLFLRLRFLFHFNFYSHFLSFGNFILIYRFIEEIVCLSDDEAEWHDARKREGEIMQQPPPQIKKIYERCVWVRLDVQNKILIILIELEMFKCAINTACHCHLLLAN